MFRRRDRPFDGRNREALMKMGIFGYVAIIVIVDERVTSNRVINRKRGEGEQETQDRSALLKGRKQTRRRKCRFSFGLWWQNKI